MAFNRLEEIEERIERVMSVAVPRSRLVDRANPLEHYDASEFSLRFHMKKETAIFIVDLVKDDLCAPIRRGVQIPPLLQVLAVLRFYATNSFQIVIGDLHTFPQPTMSKLVKRVSAAIAKRRHLFIKFPITEEEVTKTRAAFYDIASFPGVTGAIDGTHVRIISPGGDNAELFRNRKGYFSVNVQAVSNASLMFTDIVARWYGSAHDSRIFENSNIYGKLVDREWNGILLGDGGYPCLPFLLTPYDARNMGTGHSKYNKAQIKTRNVVERMFGVWKRRFPCLQFLRLKLSTSLIVIIATAVIHNILRSRGDIYDDDDYDREEVELDVNVPARNNSAQGRAMREAVVARHFT